MSASRLPPSYWIDKMRDLSEGKITGKELEEESADYMRSIGLVYNEVLGWVKPQELEDAGIKPGSKVVPTYTESTDKGKKQRINHKFQRYMEEKEREDQLRAKDQTNARSMVDYAAEGMKRVEEAPF